MKKVEAVNPEFVREEALLLKNAAAQAAPVIRSGVPGEYVDPGIDCSGDPKITVQDGKEDCDINVIVKRMSQDPQGLISHVSAVEAIWGEDGTVDVDYHTILNRVREVEGNFMSLPAHIRAKFGNDAGNLIEALDDPSREQELIDLKLLSPRPDTPAKPLVVAPATTQGQGGVEPPVAPVGQ